MRFLKTPEGTILLEIDGEARCLGNFDDYQVAAKLATECEPSTEVLNASWINRHELQPTVRFFQTPEKTVFLEIDGEARCLGNFEKPQNLAKLATECEPSTEILRAARFAVTARATINLHELKPTTDHAQLLNALHDALERTFPVSFELRVTEVNRCRSAEVWAVIRDTIRTLESTA